ncbi:UNVERIFIED_CONTAM: hypothetical protein K2H54_037959 [Gekko kuhli]
MRFLSYQPIKSIQLQSSVKALLDILWISSFLSFLFSFGLWRSRESTVFIIKFSFLFLRLATITMVATRVTSMHSLVCSVLFTHILWFFITDFSLSILVLQLSSYNPNSFYGCLHLLCIILLVTVVFMFFLWYFCPSATLQKHKATKEHRE